MKSIMSRTREGYDGLRRTDLVNRADIAHIAGVAVETVQTWGRVSPGFPDPVRRRGASNALLYEVGPIVDWLCLTGRLDCGWEQGMMTQEQIAEHFGVRPVTVKSWRASRIFPEPDLRIGRVPFWSASIVEAFGGQRPSKKRRVESVAAARDLGRALAAADLRRASVASNGSASESAAAAEVAS